MNFNRYKNLSARLRTIQPSSSQSMPNREARVSWLGLPPVDWSLTLVGVCVYTFVILTFKLNAATVGVAIGAVGILLQKEKVRLPFPVWLFGAFLLWAFVGALQSPYRDYALVNVLDYLKLLVILVVAVNAFQTEGQLRFYLLVVLGCFVLFPVRFALVGYVMGGNVLANRLVSYQMYANSNDFATLSLLALGIAMAVTFSGSTWTLARLGAGFSAFALLVVILLTQSRGAFIGLVVGMGPALVLIGAKRPGRLIVYGGIIALVIGLAIPSSAWERLSGMANLTSSSTIARADPEGSAAQRFEVLKAGWYMLLDHPVFGVGLGTYAVANATYAPHVGMYVAHNTYLSVAAETGVPGFILWLACIGSVLRYAYRIRRHAAPSALATQQSWIERGFFAFLLAATFGSYSQLILLYLMLSALWCSATLLASASPQVKGAARGERA